MKKLLLTLTGVLALGLVYAYTPTKSDNQILESVYPQIDKIINSDRPRAERIKSNIEKARKNYANKEQLYYILTQLDTYLETKLNASSEVSRVLSGIFSEGASTGTMSDSDNKIIYNAKIAEVVDGDTVKVYLSGTVQSIRMIGIDAPESYTTRYGYVECGGVEASDHIKTLLKKGDEVEIETDPTQGERDKYSRLLAYVWYSGTNINQEMIQDGFAWEYTYSKNYKYKNDFVKSQDYAKQNDLGIYSANLCNGERKAVVEKTQTTSEDTNQETVSTPVTTTTDTYTFTCGAKTKCGQMTSCAEAKFYLNSCGLSRLDGDKDGVPCESLCK